MIKIIKITISSILLLALISFILSLTITLLSSKIENEKVINTILEVFTLLTFFIVSMYIGKQIGAKGLLIAMLLVVIYLLSTFIFNKVEFSFLSILLSLSKIFTITSGSIIGVNI